MDNAAPGPDEGPAEPQLRITVQPDDSDAARGVVWVPDGGHLLVLTGVVGVWAFDAASTSLQERGWFGFAEDREPPPPGLTQDLSKLQEWVGRHASVEEVVVTPDGHHVIGGGRDGLAVWRLTPTAQPVATLVGKPAGEDHDFYGMALAPDGRRLVTLRRPPREQAEAARSQQGFEYDPEGKIELWDVDPGSSSPLHLRGEVLLKDRPSAAAITIDGQFAAVIGSSQMLGVARLEENAVKLNEQDADDTLGEIVALPDDRFATGGFDQVVRLWQLDRDEARLVQLAVLDHVHGGKLRALAAAADGRWLVAASDDHAVSFWPTAWSPERVAAPVLLRPPIEYVHDLAVHPGGPWLATAGDGVRVWRLNRDRLAEGAGSQKSVVTQVRAEVTDAPVIAAGWIGEEALVTASSDGRVQRWQDGKATELRAAGSDTRFVADVADGFAVLGQRSGTIVVVDLASGAQTERTPDPPEPLAELEMAGECVATGAGTGAVQTGAVQTWRRAGTTLTPAGKVEAGLERVATIAWTRDAKVLLVTGDEEGNGGKLMVYAVDPSTCVAETGTVVAIPPTPMGSVGSSVSYPGGGGAAPIAAAFSADGGSLLTGDRDGGAAILWRVEAGPSLVKVEFLSGHTSGVFAAGFSPDGKYAVTAGDGGEVYLWDVARRARVEALQPAGQPAWFHEDVVFSPSGTRVALPGGWSRHGRVWWYSLAL